MAGAGDHRDPIRADLGAGKRRFYVIQALHQFAGFAFVAAGLRLAGIVSLMIALGFTAVGAWLILPFAGIEIAGLGIAAWLVLRRAGDPGQGAGFGAAI